MRLHARELTVASLVGASLIASDILSGRIYLALPIAVIFLSWVWLLRLAPHRSRDLYPLIVPLLLVAGLFGITRTLTLYPWGFGLLLTGTFLFYQLARASISRKDEPRVDLPLHQNSYLAGVWITGLLSLYTLGQLNLWPLAVVGAFLVTFLLAQSLSFHFLIPPWEFRRAALAAALLATELFLVANLWFTTAFFGAALVMLLLYLFWGVSYQSRRGTLTRHLIYEYGLVSLALLIVLIVTNPWTIGS